MVYGIRYYEMGTFWVRINFVSLLTSAQPNILLVCMKSSLVTDTCDTMHHEHSIRKAQTALFHH